VTLPYHKDVPNIIYKDVNKYNLIEVSIEVHAISGDKFNNLDYVRNYENGNE